MVEITDETPEQHAWLVFQVHPSTDSPRRGEAWELLSIVHTSSPYRRPSGTEIGDALAKTTAATALGSVPIRLVPEGEIVHYTAQARQTVEVEIDPDSVEVHTPVEKAG